MARNKLSDLNDHLFEQLERLSDEDLTEEQLEKEIKRAKAVSGIAKTLSTKPKQLEKFHAEGTE